MMSNTALSRRIMLQALITVFLLFIIPVSLRSQNKGLSQPQQSSMLPKSRVAVVMPEVAHKIAPHATLVKSYDNEWIVSGGWELEATKKINAAGIEISGSKINTDTWIKATVPGTILTTLVNQGYYPDPLYGLNNLSIPDTLCRTDWWYRTILPLPEGSENKKIILLMNGINYKAEVWLNGSMVGTITGAFIRGQFDITSLLHFKGSDILAVHILPPPHPGIPHEENLLEMGPNGGLLCYDGPTFVCTEAVSYTHLTLPTK